MLVSLDEVLDAMNRPQLTERQRAHIEAVILPGVQNSLEEHLNRKVEKTRIRESLTPDQDGFIYFSETPVWSVVEVAYTDGTVLDISTQQPTPPSLPAEDIRTFDYALKGISSRPFKFYTGYLNPYSSTLLRTTPYYWATYYAGYPGEFDATLKSRIMEVSVREASRFLDAVGMRGGSIEPATENDNRLPMWTEDELNSLDRIRRRVIL